MQPGVMLDADSGRVLVPRALRAETVRERMRGLLGRPGLAADEGLLLSPCGSIHTFFMTFPIDAVFLDRAFTIVAVRARLAPWRFSAARRAAMTLELPAGAAARLELAAGQALRWEAGRPAER